MLDFQISYRGSKGVEVFGADKVATKSVEELLEYTQTLLIDVSKQFLRQEISNGTFPNEYITIVDNRVGKKEETVRPLGKIEYVTKVGDVALAIKDIFKFVAERSPIRSGYFSSMHVLLFNGKVVAKGYSNAAAWLDQDRNYKNSDKFRIINLSPYARKLERLGIRRGTRGKSKGQIERKYRKTRTRSGLATRAPNGTYWLAKNAARRLYPQLKQNIRFSFIPVSPSLASNQNIKNFKTDYRFKTGRGRGRPYLYPSITIVLNQSSFSSNAAFTEIGDTL